MKPGARFSFASGVRAWKTIADVPGREFDRLAKIMASDATTQGMARRCHAMLKLREKIPLSKVATSLGVAQKTVRAWRAEFLDGGGYRAWVRRDVGPTRSEFDQRVLDCFFNVRPPNDSYWTPADLAAATGHRDEAVSATLEYYQLLFADGWRPGDEECPKAKSMAEALANGKLKKRQQEITPAQEEAFFKVLPDALTPELAAMAAGIGPKTLAARMEADEEFRTRVRVALSAPLIEVVKAMKERAVGYTTKLYGSGAEGGWDRDHHVPGDVKAQQVLMFNLQSSEWSSQPEPEAPPDGMKITMEVKSTGPKISIEAIRAKIQRDLEKGKGGKD